MNTKRHEQIVSFKRLMRACVDYFPFSSLSFSSQRSML